jgi:tRNA (mo5U34)-methyltransferase
MAIAPRQVLGSPAMPPTPEQAAAFVRDATFVWHQRFELAPGVSTPGSNDIGWLVQVAGLPDDLSGKTVLDIGTTNGGAAFALERRNPARVVAVDIFPPDWFGVTQLTELLESKVEYVRTSVYELSERFPEPFDVVLFWGVLYHLRHPLLALDNLRAVTGGQALLETAVCDSELKRRDRDRSLVRYYRGDELSNDPSNWFSPTTRALEDWCASGGFGVERVGAWPAKAPARAMLRLTPEEGPAEYERISYERPLRSSVTIPFG